MSDYQLPSWFDPCGYFESKPLQFPEGWLVSQIYFPTNVSTLDGGDKKALDLLYSVYILGCLSSQKQRFTLVGYADYRDTEQHNLNLGMARAFAVKTYLDQLFRNANSFVSDAKSRGEQYATKSNLPDVLAADRRVDVFAPYREKTQIVIKPQPISGGYTGTLVWQEVDPEAPTWSVGAAKDKGEAVGELVGVLQRAFDDKALNTAIKKEFTARTGEARGHLRGHRTGGLVAEAYIIVRYDPSNAFGVRGQKPAKNFGPVARRLSSLNIGSQVYGRPQDGIAVRQAERKKGMFMEERPNPGCEYSEMRYYWGHWKEVK